MKSFHQLTLLALPLLGSVACAEPASPTTEEEGTKPFYANANEAFQDLLNALPEESLHAALNSLGHFRAGIFESDRHGVERVHQDDPPLATKLIVAAVQDLKKRQYLVPRNATGPNKPVVVPVPIETTDSEGRTTTATSSILSQPTASIAVTTTRTNDRGETEVATETKPALIISTTDSAGRPIETTSTVDFIPTSGQILTRTDTDGSTFLTTYTPDIGLISSVKLITTTGDDGKPTVLTSYTVVGASQTTNGNGNPSGTQTGEPGLQTGAATRNRAVEAAMMGGALGGALAFFV